MKAAISIPRTTPDTAGLMLWAKSLALSGGRIHEAVRIAEQVGAPESVKRAMTLGGGSIDAIVKGGMSISEGSAEGIVAARQIATSFAASLRNSSIFFGLLESGAMTRVPLRTRFSSTTARATAFVSGEGSATPISRLEIAGDLVDLQRAAGFIILSRELLESAGSAAEAFLSRELRRAMAAVVDEGLLNTIVDSGTAAFPSAGADADAALEDIRGLAEAVNLTAESRPMFGLAPDVARNAALLYGSGGSKIFPAFGLAGGTILDVPAIVTDGLPAGTLALFDGAKLGGDLETMSVTASADTTLTLSDTPTMDSTTPTATEVVSLYQTDCIAVLASCWFGARRLDPSAVALVNNVAWGEAEGSGT
ncbi:phage major capsid protein [Faunimonas sp. B44]|uniref:phage major capsid protein n=1 Tax=Faunimonas sp. B44 TaxID=3461493 RepID=UPI004043A5AC